MIDVVPAYLPTLDWEDESHEALRFSVEILSHEDICDTDLFQQIIGAVADLGGRIWIEPTDFGQRINATLPVSGNDDEDDVVETFANLFQPTTLH